MKLTRANSSRIARRSPAWPGAFGWARRQAWKAYPTENGGLTNKMLGPSKLSECPQQNKIDIPMPRGGSTAGKISAAHPDSGPHRDSSPATAPHANNPRINTISSGLMTKYPVRRGWHHHGLADAEKQTSIETQRLRLVPGNIEIEYASARPAATVPSHTRDFNTFCLQVNEGRYREWCHPLFGKRKLRDAARRMESPREKIFGRPAAIVCQV